MKTSKFVAFVLIFALLFSVVDVKPAAAVNWIKIGKIAVEVATLILTIISDASFETRPQEHVAQYSGAEKSLSLSF